MKVSESWMGFQSFHREEHMNVQFTDNSRRTLQLVCVCLQSFQWKLLSFPREYSRVTTLEGASLFFIHSESTCHKDDVLQPGQNYKLNEKRELSLRQCDLNLVRIFIIMRKSFVHILFTSLSKLTAENCTRPIGTCQMHLPSLFPYKSNCLLDLKSRCYCRAYIQRQVVCARKS